MSTDTDSDKSGPPLRLVPASPDEPPPVEQRDGADVVPIRLHLEPVRGTFCRHFRQSYCKEQHWVKCTDCGAELGTFEAYRILAENFGRLLLSQQCVTDDVKRKQSELDELARLEQNTKARIRRADPFFDPNIRWRGDAAEKEADYDRLGAMLNRPAWKEMEKEWLRLKTRVAELEAENARLKREKRR